MENIISDIRQPINFESPEFQDLLSEVMNQKEAINKRKELSEVSFRDWLCDVIAILADKLGYIIQNLKEIPMDMAYSFSSGFQAGRERAHQNSYRNREKKTNIY